MPPRAISTPAKTKKMTASSGKVLIEVSMRWTIVALSTPGSSRVATTERDADRKRDRHADRGQDDEGEAEQRRGSSALVHRRAVRWRRLDGRTIASTMSLNANTMIRKPEIGIAG